MTGSTQEARRLAESLKEQRREAVGPTSEALNMDGAEALADAIIQLADAIEWLDRATDARATALEMGGD